MADADKIRILWVDDRERVSGYPEKVLPAELADLFDVVHPYSSANAVMSYDSAETFVQEFEGFWRSGTDTGHFPAEIVAIDYNLQKRAAGDRGDDETLSLSLRDRVQKSGETNAMVYAQSGARVNFDGLLIASFYATLTYRHPAALVSITNYDGDMPSEVHSLRTLVTPFLSVATQYTPSACREGREQVWHNLPATERSWRNIIQAATGPLRRRIEFLHQRGEVAVSPEDLSSLLNAETGMTHLRIGTCYGSRRLPLKGLFIDVPEESTQQEEIESFARRLLESSFRQAEAYRMARELADKVWEVYNLPGLESGADLVDARRELSVLMSAIEDGADQPIETRERLRELQEQFRVQGRICREHLCDVIRYGKNHYSDEVRRWAALFVIFNLLRTAVRIRSRIRAEMAAELPDARLSEDYPSLSAEDIYLALFPLPEEAILPKVVDKSHGWVRSLNRLKREKMVGTNVGDVCLHIPDVLAGCSWQEGGPHGLRKVERLVLQGILLQEVELHESEWHFYGPARRIIWGADQEEA